ncbi:ParA family protein [Cellulomonas sp. C5510]|uniref:ParA family protein n=1 Tax=Cellulomonas sp. C5510 TaxID=2871170 RepID=UPI002104B090|nr:ParA family protein [Cellulomonas sp. C5510]
MAAALLFGSDVKLLNDVRRNLDVIVGGDALHAASAALAASKGRTDPRLALARVLAPLAGDYDMVLIDCPPGNEALQSAAITAARWALVPSKADEGTARGLTEIARRLDQVIDVNPDLDLLGVVLFDVENQATNVRENARRMIAEVIGTRAAIFDAVIRHSSSVAQQARGRGLLVHELDEAARRQPEWWQIRRGVVAAGELVTRTAASVADDLHALTTQLVTRLNDRENQEASA